MEKKFDFKKVKGSSKYLPWKNWVEGQYIIGTFKEQTTDKFGNPSYRIEVIETDLDKIEEGDTFTLNSSGSLNYKMLDVEVGSVIRVEYEGIKIKDKPGDPFDGREYHAIDLQEDAAHVPTAESIKQVQDEVVEEEDYGEDL